MVSFRRPVGGATGVPYTRRSADGILFCSSLQQQMYPLELRRKSIPADLVPNRIPALPHFWLLNGTQCDGLRG
ncbi:MAG: hypothetical protein NT138_01165 [Planctomycetales bacterium]|nr:hypothetical protein [Planctomycetales bacterium]